MSDRTEPENNETAEENQPDHSEVGETERQLELLREEIGRATAGALTALESQHDIEGETELYQTLGFEPETVTIELELRGPELFELFEVFDELTRGTIRAEQMVVRGRIFSELLDELDPALAKRWVDNGHREFARRDA